MDHPYSRNIIEILRSTLRRLEQDTEFPQDDPAVAQLKRHILQSLAELESQKAPQTGLESQPSQESRPGFESQPSQESQRTLDSQLTLESEHGRERETPISMLRLR
jgi:hypothetical protein